MKKASKLEPAVGPARCQAVIYARVSSKEQEKEGFSIPAQLKLLRDYAASNGFAISHEYVDVETAKQTGRAAFGEMVAHLRAGAPSGSGNAGREDGSALSQPQGLGDGRRP
jgi:hypothetical protein